MIGNFRKKKFDALEEPINAVLNEMSLYGPDSEEFAAQLTHLERLNRLKTESRERKFSHDTMLIVAGNLLGILIVVMYEQKHVMTSKAFGLTLKKNP